MNDTTPWNENLLKRLVLEIAITFPVALLMGYIFGHLIFWSNPLIVDPYNTFIFNFLVISGIMNLILVVISDWFYFFERWKEPLIETEKSIAQNALLEREKIQAQYEVLKNQVNPHFLFNSLNVLSSLIHSDPRKAEEFVDKFSDLYRYILEKYKEKFVLLSAEVNICKSYIFLQEIRFDNNIQCQFDIKDEELKKYFVFPLSVQRLLEHLEVPSCFRSPGLSKTVLL